jgi:hypothetical protein
MYLGSGGDFLTFGYLLIKFYDKNFAIVHKAMTNITFGNTGHCLFLMPLGN